MHEPIVRLIDIGIEGDVFSGLIKMQRADRHPLLQWRFARELVRQFASDRHGGGMFPGGSAQAGIQLQGRCPHTFALEVCEFQQPLLGPRIVVPELLSGDRMNVGRGRGRCGSGCFSDTSFSGSSS